MRFPRYWGLSANRLEGKSIRSLFGEDCSGDNFEHDLKMEAMEAQMSVQESQLSQNHDNQGSFRSLEISELGETGSSPPGDARDQPIAILDEGGEGASQVEGGARAEGRKKRDFEAYARDSQDSGSQSSARVSWARVEAYNAMMKNVLGSGEGGWEGIALISTGSGHTRVEPELGG